MIFIIFSFEKLLSAKTTDTKIANIILYVIYGFGKKFILFI